MSLFKRLDIHAHKAPKRRPVKASGEHSIPVGERLAPVKSSVWGAAAPVLNRYKFINL